MQSLVPGGFGALVMAVWANSGRPCPSLEACSFHHGSTCSALILCRLAVPRSASRTLTLPITAAIWDISV
eukprot:46700-Eustigmatos_ZCMA.PRE.1